MATVWAHRVGDWVSDPGSGWSHTIKMNALTDLMNSMSRAKLKGVVTQLAIVAHGDQPGQVVLDRVMSPSTVAGFRDELHDLRYYLMRDAMLSFYSCIAGKDREGSELLCALSKELPGRTIVAFELYGYIGAMGNMPGRMDATDASITGGDGIPKSRLLGKLSPWGKFAKRAQNGQIVHYPLLEQSARSEKKCANPGCPGHSDAQHSCSGW